MHARMRVPLLEFINSYATWLGRKRTTYVGIVRDQSTENEVTTELPFSDL
jgi:hypothetical protein